jgi:hypothetical protein
MKIYYAHPMSWYGTDREKDDVTLLLANTPLHTEVVNPNAPEHRAAVETLKAQGNEARIMGYFLDRLAVCDAIAYRTFDDGRISAGVAQELLTAALHGKQIFRFRDPGKLYEEHGLQAAFGPRVLTITQTRDLLRRGIM